MTQNIVNYFISTFISYDGITSVKHLHTQLGFSLKQLYSYAVFNK